MEGRTRGTSVGLSTPWGGEAGEGKRCIAKLGEVRSEGNNRTGNDAETGNASHAKDEEE